MSDNNLVHRTNPWDIARDSYTKWFANSKIKNFFSENIKYKNLSLWWITRNANKDNTVENEWYSSLKILLNKEQKIKYNKKLFFILFILKFIKNFIIDLIFFSLLKILFRTRYKKIERKNCFYSIEFDLVQNNKLSFDRMYSLTPLKKRIKDNFYLINVVNYFNFLKNFILYKKLFNKLKIPFIISNEFISLKEIIQIYFVTFVSFLKLVFFLRKNKKFYFINGIDCKNVLEPLLLSSFSGTIQNSLIDGLSVKNFLMDKKINFFINYIEFNPRSRSIYHFIRQTNSSTKSVSYQGSLCNENVLPYLHKSKEFTKNKKKEGYSFSPSPDYYFVQGKQFKKLLSSYYKKRIFVIGSLRYDIVKFKKIIKKRNKIKSILICPSIGDEEMIISYLNNLSNKNFKFILSPHPAVRKETIKLFKENLSKAIKIEIKNSSSFEMIKKVDFVICGLSSMALEANLSNVDSARIVDHKYQNIFDPNDGVQVLNHYKEIPINSRKQVRKKISKSINYLFYKLDKSAYKRFWSSIKTIEKINA